MAKWAVLQCSLERTKRNLTRLASPDLVHRMMEIAHQPCKVATSAKTALNAAHNTSKDGKARFRAAFLWVKEGRKCLENSDRNSLKVKYFARGRQLADGEGDLEFAIKLNALSEEYEGDANGQNPEVTPVGAITYPVQKGDKQKPVTKGAASVGVPFHSQCRSALAKRGAACTEVHLARSANRKIAIRPSGDAQQSIYYPARYQQKDRDEGDSRKVCPHTLAIIVLAL